MFYAKAISKALRFGDVVRGYFSTTPNIKEPTVGAPIKRYNIDVDTPIYSVIIDPCSQIGEKTISLAPLIPIRSSFYDNPYLMEDLTRINRKMETQQAIPPHAWKEMSQEDREKRLAVGHEYAFPSLFIYEKHDLLPPYPVHRKQGNVETNYYMINFRDIYKLCCDKINTPTDAPLESKVLELSIETRKELREKITSHYGYIPKEDKVLED
jgi:hypothetical protein